MNRPVLLDASFLIDLEREAADGVIGAARRFLPTLRGRAVVISVVTIADTKPLRGRSIMPSLTVNNIEESLTFFAALGFEMEDPWVVDGVMQGAMLKGGEARLGLAQDDGKKGLNRVKGVGVRLYIEADGDIGAVAAGVTLNREPHDTEWGTRAFEVTEPSGFLLTIASPASK